MPSPKIRFGHYVTVNPTTLAKHFREAKPTDWFAMAAVLQYFGAPQWLTVTCAIAGCSLLLYVPLFTLTMVTLGSLQGLVSYCLKTLARVLSRRST